VIGWSSKDALLGVGLYIFGIQTIRKVNDCLDVKIFSDESIFDNISSTAVLAIYVRLSTGSFLVK
jgi:hypothetical protein